MNKLLNKLLFSIECLLIVIIVITFFLVAYNFFQLRVKQNDHVNFFGYSVFEVVSNSMSPTIEKKDVIIIKLDDDIEVDDIITYRNDGSFVTHRVIEKNRDSYITRGDANNSTDVPVMKEDVLGRVVRTVSGLGVWREVIMTPSVLVSIIATIGLLNLAVIGTNGMPKMNGIRKDYRITKEGFIEEVRGVLDG